MTRCCPENSAAATGGTRGVETLLLPDPFSLQPLSGSCLALLDLCRLDQCLVHYGETTFLKMYLTDTEQELLAGLRFGKRRRQWLGGRLAGKWALNQLLPLERRLPFTALGLLPDPLCGKPVVHADDFPGTPGISLSHSGDFAVALATVEGRCGVDMQQCSPQLLRVREKFATGAECALFQSEEEMTRLAVLWVTKEAMKKCFLAEQSVFFGGLLVTAVSRLGEGGWTLQCQVHRESSRTATVHVRPFDSFMLACVREGSYA